MPKMDGFLISAKHMIKIYGGNLPFRQGEANDVIIVLGQAVVFLMNKNPTVQVSDTTMLN